MKPQNFYRYLTSPLRSNPIDDAQKLSIVIITRKSRHLTTFFIKSKPKCTNKRIKQGYICPQTLYFPSKMILSSSFWLPLQSQVQGTHFSSKTIKEPKAYWLTLASLRLNVSLSHSKKKLHPIPPKCDPSCL